jgi:hypothetical protein
MGKARDRLMQLGLAQREAEEVAQESAKSALPTGGEFAATKLARPSEAKDIEAETTPLIDFGEYFLNNLGITSPRQVRASIEHRKSVHEANTAMIGAAKEKLAIVSRQVGGIDADRLQGVVASLDEAASLMNNKVPEIQEFGREQLQNSVADLDKMLVDQKTYLEKQNTRFQGQIDEVIQAGRIEQRESATILGLLNERGDREATSKLSITEKQALSEYLGGANFAQKAGADGILPSLAIPFDPTEQITVGDASVLVQAAAKNRRLVLADQLGDINSTIIESGFTLENRDGVLTVTEIVSPPLAEDIATLRHKTPAGIPLNIRQGMATPESTRQAVEGLFNNLSAGAEAVPLVGDAIQGAKGFTSLFSMSEEGKARRAKLAEGREPGLFQQRKTLPTNGD